MLYDFGRVLGVVFVQSKASLATMSSRLDILKWRRKRQGRYTQKHRIENGEGRVEVQAKRSDDLPEMEGQHRGSAPSRGHNEMYNGGAKDALFGCESVAVPTGLNDRSAGGDGRDVADESMGTGDDDDVDDGDVDDGEMMMAMVIGGTTKMIMRAN